MREKQMSVGFERSFPLLTGLLGKKFPNTISKKCVLLRVGTVMRRGSPVGSTASQSTLAGKAAPVTKCRKGNGMALI